MDEGCEATHNFYYSMKSDHSLTGWVQGSPLGIFKGFKIYEKNYNKTQDDDVCEILQYFVLKFFNNIRLLKNKKHKFIGGVGKSPGDMIYKTKHHMVDKGCEILQNFAFKFFK